MTSYLQSLSQSILFWMISGISLRVWAILNFILCMVIFGTMMESVKIETKLEKMLVLSVLVSLSLLEILLLALLWLSPRR